MQEAMQEATRAKLPGHSFPPTPKTNVVGRPRRRPSGGHRDQFPCICRASSDVHAPYAWLVLLESIRLNAAVREPCILVQYLHPDCKKTFFTL